MQYLYPNIPLKRNEKHFFRHAQRFGRLTSRRRCRDPNRKSSLFIFTGPFPVYFLWRIWDKSGGCLESRRGGQVAPSLPAM